MMLSVHTSMMQDKPHGQDKLERAETSSVGSGTRAVLRERELAEIVYRTEKAASCSCLDQDANRLKLISGTLAVKLRSP
ncbi:hypothetical protein F2Q69_00002765 [Brassica cretica]|uniref:Uncharacterized protein n=1 Tax=Brassica cretica TaxID=69181 RepID=A0A8S9P2W8_BRACR|nr:hypothetical protein F2Q69_00002765 [Brassica cretica]